MKIEKQGIKFEEIHPSKFLELAVDEEVADYININIVTTGLSEYNVKIDTGSKEAESRVLDIFSGKK